MFVFGTEVATPPSQLTVLQGYSCLTGPNTWGGTCATQGFQVRAVQGQYMQSIECAETQASFWQPGVCMPRHMQDDTTRSSTPPPTNPRPSLPPLLQSPIAINYDERFPPAGDPGLDILYPRFPRYIKDGVTVKNTGHGTMQVGGAGRAAGTRGAQRCARLVLHEYDFEAGGGIEAPTPLQHLISSSPHTPPPPWQVSMPDGVDYYLRGQRHRLLQFHFHTPSEHTLDGAWGFGREDVAAGCC